MMSVMPDSEGTEQVIEAPTVVQLHPDTPRERLVTLRRIVITALVGVALVGFWYAGAGIRSEEEIASQTDSAVEATFPGEAELDVRQARIGVDLASGLRADIALDGVPIPESELQRVDPLGIVYYIPAPNRSTGALAPGRHCAQAVIWDPTRETRQSGGHTFSWCFTLH